MQLIPTALPEVKLLSPKVFTDARGYFFEAHNARRFAELTGRAAEFVQDNHSWSARGVLRGLHYQINQPQGKLVRVLAGEIFDVAVDIRRHSPNFGKWVGVRLSAENRHQIWVPEGFAHGFVVVSEFAEVLYKVTDYWASEHERTLRWDDPEIGIAWPDVGPLVLSEKDQAGKPLCEAELFDLQAGEH